MGASSSGRPPDARSVAAARLSQIETVTLNESFVFAV
jgi:hypothetical protein